jgi:hypothetical protein
MKQFRNLEIKPHIYSQLSFDKMPRTYSSGRIFASINSIGKTGSPRMEE